MNKCVYCGNPCLQDQKLIKVTAERYAHKKCWEEFNRTRLNKKESDIRLEALKAYINEAFKGLNPNWPLIMKEIKRLQSMGVGYDRTYRILIYCFEVKKMDRFKFNGHIGIIGNFIEEADKYYKDIGKYNKARVKEMKEAKQISIPLPRSKPKLDLIDLEDDESYE